MKIRINKNLCKGCALCVVECDKKIIYMGNEKNSSGHIVAQTSNEYLCTGCLKCATVCPDCAIEIINEIKV